MAAHAMHVGGLVAVPHGALGVSAAHVTVASPDGAKPVSHANVATLAWSSAAENTTVPSVGAAGVLEHVFTVHVGGLAAVPQGALGVIAAHVTVASPDGAKPVSHANVAILAWSSAAENTTVPSVGAAGVLEHVF